MQNKNANVKYEQRIGGILYDVHFKATRDKKKQIYSRTYTWVDNRLLKVQFFVVQPNEFSVFFNHRPIMHTVFMLLRKRLTWCCYAALGLLIALFQILSTLYGPLIFMFHKIITLQTAPIYRANKNICWMRNLILSKSLISTTPTITCFRLPCQKVNLNIRSFWSWEILHI